METSLLITLQNYGFSEKEAKVYLTVLELGTSIASTIARRSEIKRVTVYTILDDLKRKWIANETTKDDVKYYSVISPDILLKQLEQKFESFKEKVPELLALADKFGNRPKVQFFEGGEGIKKMYNDLLTSIDEDIHSFLGLEEVNKTFLQWLYKEFLPQRIKLWIKAKVISYTGESNKEYKSIDKKSLKQTKFISKEGFVLHYEVNIYGKNKVWIAMFGNDEMSGIILHNKKFHDTMLSIFDFIWEK